MNFFPSFKGFGLALTSLALIYAKPKQTGIKFSLYKQVYKHWMKGS